jgi:hypothetical protein
VEGDLDVLLFSDRMVGRHEDTVAPVNGARRDPAAGVDGDEALGGAADHRDECIGERL